jgi:hypothetical protein
MAMSRLSTQVTGASRLLAPHRLSLRQQPVENSRVSARHVDYLRPACSPRHQCYRTTADTERRSDRGQGCRRRPAIYGRRADPDDQRTVVLAAYARNGWPRV